MKIRHRAQEWELEGERSVREAVQAVGLDPDQVLVIREGKVLDQRELVREEDRIQVLSLIAGG